MKKESFGQTQAEEIRVQSVSLEEKKILKVNGQKVSAERMAVEANTETCPVRASTLIHEAAITAMSEEYPRSLSSQSGRIIFILFTSTIFLILGGILSKHNDAIIYQKQEFDSNCDIPSGQTFQSCSFGMTVEEDMSKPVYLYYHLTKVWQIHSDFVVSVSVNQIGGDADSTNACRPHHTGKDGKTLIPCGLQGQSFYNDKFNVAIEGKCSAQECLDDNDIAIAPEKKRFTNTEFDPNNFTRTTVAYEDHDGHKIRDSIEIPPLSDEHLQVWMRTAATNTFHKLHSKLQHDLHKGDVLQFNVEANFNTNVFGGKKSFAISTAGTLGGKHPIMQTLFFLFGSLGLIGIVMIVIVHSIVKKRF